VTFPVDPDFADGKCVKTPVVTPPTWAWSAVVVANLPVTALLGWLITVEMGRVGMACGILLLYWLGYLACFLAGEYVRTVIYGAWVVAVSQTFPLLQIVAGAPANLLVQVMERGEISETGPPESITTLLGGLLATLVTGSILIASAAAFGVGIRVIIRLLRHCRRPEAA